MAWWGWLPEPVWDPFQKQKNEPVCFRRTSVQHWAVQDAAPTHPFLSNPLALALLMHSGFGVWCNACVVCFCLFLFFFFCLLLTRDLVDIRRNRCVRPGIYRHQCAGVDIRILVKAQCVDPQCVWTPLMALCSQREGGMDDEQADMEGENGTRFEEYEWCGQKRIRATSLLEGGFRGKCCNFSQWTFPSKIIHSKEQKSLAFLTNQLNCISVNTIKCVQAWLGTWICFLCIIVIRFYSYHKKTN